MAEYGFLRSDLDRFKREADQIAGGYKSESLLFGRTDIFKPGSDIVNQKYIANKFIKQGGTSMPTQRTVHNAAPGNVISGAAGNKELETMANVLKARIANIQTKRARPGLMQTRGQR